MPPAVPPDPPSLRRELRDLTLVAAGAVPGALLRWRLGSLGSGLEGPLAGLLEANLTANLIGSLLLGVIAGLPAPRPRLMLLGGIGFCGSLTTFSGWILQISLDLRAGRPLEALGVILISLAGGLLAVGLGLLAGRRIGRGRLRR